MAKYRTKTQAKRACMAIESKAFGLFEHGCMTLNDVNGSQKKVVNTWMMHDQNLFTNN